ncbi:MAG TPA: methionyl-tRNA formyltransferase [Burkholderiales bacterium]|nr:methionyl-tRNA formyltransferase [Burkholderiales bacterium]
MKVIFAGTPTFAATALQALLEAGHEIVLVLTQPDRRAGRGLHNTASAVKQAAQTHRLAVQQPTTLRDAAVVQSLADLRPDVMVVAAYGLILPAPVPEVPPRGCLNIHASLLPRWRGAAPIQRAILEGDRQTGVTIMQMDAGLDTGCILLQQAVSIEREDTAGSLHEKLARLGGELIVKALASELVPVPQDGTLATYAAKIQKAETHIDWRREATAIERQVRAFNPTPGAFTEWRGTTLKIWSATALPGSSGAPGSVCETGAAGLVVAGGNGALRITELQRAGGTRLAAAAFLAGCALEPGARLGE